MSNDVEAIITGIVGPLVGGRLYWDTTPNTGPPKNDAGDYLPFVIAQIVGGQDETFIDQSFPDYENARVQLASWSPSSLAASDLSRVVRKALLAAYRPMDIIGSPMATYDPRLLLRGRVQHFSVWYKP